jgi:serine/threonine-protein kinase HipA
VKRFDRYKKGRRIEKLACEDMHQILGGPSKYAGSHEQIAMAIRKHCTFVPLELQRLFEMVIFNYAIGNGDAHRKNFSLLTSEDGTIALSPAYDLVSSRLAIPAESDELALTVNGKRNQLHRADFLAFADHLSIERSYSERRIADLLSLRGDFAEMVAASLLSPTARKRLAEILTDRLDRLRE